MGTRNITVDSEFKDLVPHASDLTLSGRTATLSLRRFAIWGEFAMSHEHGANPMRNACVMSAGERPKLAEERP